jgi:hypothetical protein
VNIETENLFIRNPSAIYIYDTVRFIYTSGRKTLPKLKQKRAIQKIFLLNDYEFKKKYIFMNKFISILKSLCNNEKGITLGKCRREGDGFVVDDSGYFDCIILNDNPTSSKESLGILREFIDKMIRKYKNA